MANVNLGKVIRNLRQSLERRDVGGLSDAELLQRLVAERDQAAFEVLVWRHGALVLCLCRRLLRHEQDAEDAFQAAFFVLLRKAGSIGKRQAVSSWLYKVAFRVSLRLRARQRRRAERERPGQDVAAQEGTPELIWRDLRPVLDEEVHRLPEKYRVPFLLCYLEGLTNAEAARQLGCPRGTILSRLAWARQRLRDRLVRRGLTLSATALTAGLSVAPASAALPTTLVQTTLKAGLLLAASKPVAGAVSAQAVALTQGVIYDMFLTKLKIVAAVLLGLGALALGVGGLAAQRAPQDNPSASRARAPVPDKAPAVEVAVPTHPPQDGTKHKTVLLRVPNHGIQPQVAVDAKGVVHLLYFKGDPDAGDIFYARSEDGVSFSKHPVRVNSQPGSAMAIGNIRGAHLALGKNGRVHVAWNGSQKALPKAVGHAQPMLYTRLNDGGTAFEPQRNLIQAAVILDGGGSVAADNAGNVYVFWHAPEPGTKGEANRRVWVAASTDDGKTFAAERAAYAEPTGACGCCGLRAFADSKGTVYALYRGAKEKVHRDMYLLTSLDKGKNFAGANIHPWSINTCPMSSETFAEGPQGMVVSAWDTEGQVYFAKVAPTTGKRSLPIAAPGTGKGRKHPAVAVNAKGETLLVWTEGMGWNKGGSLAWQVYDGNGTPTAERGHAAGVPVWSLVAVFVRPDGQFVVVYSRSRQGSRSAVGQIDHHGEARYHQLMFTIVYTEGLLEDLKGLRATDRKRILDKIEKHLQHNPSEQTRNKKILVGLKPPWEHEEPVWELRIGTYRIFYDVNEEEHCVVVRAVRTKPPHQTTKEIL